MVKTIILTFFLLGVSEALEFIVSLKGTYVIMGKPFWWTCSARREHFQEYLIYRWKFMNVSITSTDAGFVDFGNGTIHIPEVTRANLGEYTCKVSDGRQSIESHGSLQQSYTNARVDVQSRSQQVVRLGFNHSMSCRFEAGPTAQYMWLFNGKEILDVLQNVVISEEPSRSTLMIDSATYENSGTYYCQVHHQLLTQPMQSQGITIEVHGEPQLVHPLESQSAPLGRNVTFLCEVQGQPKASVVWTMKLSSSPSLSQRMCNLGLQPDLNSSISSGSSTISVNQDGMSLNIFSAENTVNGEYSCELSNVYGTVYDRALLNVYNPPQAPVITQPLEKTTAVVEGSILKLECGGDGNPTPDVEWLLPGGERMSKIQGNELGTNGVTLAPGGLEIRNVQQKHAGKYTCLLLNTEGSSSSVTFVDVLYKPSVTNTPDAIVIDMGQRLEIPCVADGNPKPTVLWTPPWLEGITASQESYSKSDTYSVRTNGSLAIEKISHNHQGTYTCQASNNVGSVSANVQITVQGYPVIIKPPSSIGAVENDRIDLDCLVAGYPVPLIAWYFLSLPDPSVQAVDMARVLQYALHNRGNWTGEPMINLIMTPKEGVQISNGNLVIPQAKTTDAGLYVCNAQNNYGFKRAASDVRIVTFPKFDTKPVDRKVSPGDDVILHCHSSGVPVPTQRWLLNGRRVVPDARFKTLYNGSLNIASIQTEDFGDYTCVATNAYGHSSATARLVPSSRPYFETQPKNASFDEYSNGVLQCNGKSDVGFSVLWYRENMTNSEHILLGNISIGRPTSTRENKHNDAQYHRIRVENNGSLSFRCVGLEDESWYYCQLQNDDGLVKSETIYLTVNTSPRDIDIDMPSQSLAGTDSKMACEVRNSLPTLVSWITPRATEINDSNSNHPGVDVNTSILTNVYKSILTLSNVTNENHGGPWSCKACTRIGCSIVTSIFLIEDLPIVYGVTNSLSGNTINLQCLAAGLPLPVVTFFMNGQQNVDEIEGHDIDGNNLSIQRSYIQNNYSCEARNSFGSSRKSLTDSIRMAVTRIISFPTGATIEAVAEFPLIHLFPSYVIIEYKNYDSIEWKNSRHFLHGKLESYLSVFDNVQHMETLSSCSGNGTNIERDGASMPLLITSNGKMYSYSFRLTLNSLSPYAKYDIRTRLVNYLESGPISQAVATVTLPAAPPPVKAVNISVEGRTAWVSWSMPDHMNGPPEDIIVQVLVYQTQDKSTTRRRSIPVTNHPVLMFDDLAISEYQVEITAISLRLNEGSIVRHQTFIISEQVPRFIPKITEVKSLAYNHVSITWTVAIDRSQQIPPVNGYSLVISPFRKVNESDIIVNVVSANTSSLTLNRLEERQEYSVRIASRNNEGIGPFSPSYRFITVYAPFSTLPLGAADLPNTSWKLIAIGVVAALVSLGIFAAIFAITMHIKLSRRGRVEITSENSDEDTIIHEDLSAAGVEGVMNSNMMLY